MSQGFSEILAYGQTPRHRLTRNQSRLPPPHAAHDAGGRLTFVLIIGGVAFLARLIHLWQIHDAPFFSVLFGDAQAYDNWRAGSRPATGSARRCSLRARAVPR